MDREGVGARGRGGPQVGSGVPSSLAWLKDKVIDEARETGRDQLFVTAWT